MVSLQNGHATRGHAAEALASPRRTEDWQQRLNPSCRALGCELSRLGWNGSTRIEYPTEDLTIFVYDIFNEADVVVEAEGTSTISLSIVLDGTGSFTTTTEHVEFAAGTAVLFVSSGPVRGRSMFRGQQKFLIVDLRFEADLLRRACGRSLSFLSPNGGTPSQFQCPLLVGCPAPSSLIRAAEEIVRCAIPEGTRRRLFLLSKAIEALGDMVEATGCEAPEINRLHTNERHKIKAAEGLIDQRFHENWTIRRLAREVGINEKKLKEGFRVFVGRPVHAHLRERRLEAAAELLLEGRSVTEAALSVGFCSLSHFSKIFRDFRGVYPKDFLATRHVAVQASPRSSRPGS